MNEAACSASPIHILIGGKQLLLCPLRRGDFGKMLARAQDDYMAFAERTIKKNGLVGEDADRMRDRAFDRAARFTTTSPYVVDMLNTVDGAAFTLWLALRWEQPDITYEEVLEAITDPATQQINEVALGDAMEHLSQILRCQSGVIDEDSNKKKATAAITLESNGSTDT